MRGEVWRAREIGRDALPDGDRDVGPAGLVLAEVPEGVGGDLRRDQGADGDHLVPGAGCPGDELVADAVVAGGSGGRGEWHGGAGGGGGGGRKCLTCSATMGTKAAACPSQEQHCRPQLSIYNMIHAVSPGPSNRRSSSQPRSCIKRRFAGLSSAKSPTRTIAHEESPLMLGPYNPSHRPARSITK